MNPLRVHSGNSRLRWSCSPFGLALLGISALAAPPGCGTSEDPLPPVTVVSSGEPDDDPDPVDDPARPINAPTPSDEILVEEDPPPYCGDGALNDDEQCDDANREAQDGCSANCLVVEQGFACPTPGSRCELAAICGDRLQLAGEQCDDGNLDGEDGCAANCQIERDFVCPTPGQPCVSSVECGDGVISGDETCDDGNAAEGDGCGVTCLLETGWACPIVNARCLAVCGDGLLLGLEQCDDGETTSGDGCSATCGNQDGFVCAVPGEACVRAVCGNREPESNEGCDDGPNDVPFDGCFNCVREPTCTGGACGAVCGDGLLFDSEDCDDGNRIVGDGCSDECVEELGFECVAQGGTGALGDTFVLPVIYRDFIGLDTSGDPGAAARATARAAAGMSIHPDFNGEAAQGSVVFQGDGVLGAVQNQLDANRRPVFACANPAAAACRDSDNNQAFSLAANFNQWYRDDNPRVNVRVVGELELASLGNGSFLFDSATDSLNGQFDPLLELGWHDPQVVAARQPTVYESPEFCVVDQVPNPDLPTTAGATPRNLSFTTETRFVFEYAGGESFEFSGDDDVWVFVNNRLVVDLGGLHNIATGEFTLSAPPAAPGIALVDQQGPPSPPTFLDLAAPVPIDTQMNYGGVYEVVMFHAERHQCGSNFKLTLAGFDKPRSACRERCGNGVATRSETCDQGELNGTGYGFCTTTCTPGPRCGDALVNGGGEVCDNGLNVDRYSTRPDACGPGCTQPSFCGDQVVDGAFGEACDDGVNDDSYGGCSPTCQLGPRCGDREENGPEECDDGNFINGDGCNLRCEIENDIVPS